MLTLNKRYFLCLKKQGANMSLQDTVWLITIISFIGGIVTYLFKAIVIQPLRQSIDALNNTIREYKVSTDRQLEMLGKEVNFLTDKTTRHDEQIKTLFNEVR